MSEITDNNTETNIEDNNTEIKPTWINSDGSFGDLTKAPEGVGEFITRKGWKNTEAMVNSHRELETKLGQVDKMILIPADDDVEGQRRLATKLGCPENAEGYQFNLQDGDPMDDKLLSLFKQSAYRDGMPQKAFQDVVQFQIDAVKESNKLYEEQTASATAEAQKAIRGRFNSEDEYNLYTQKALGFAEKFKLSDGETTAADVIERKGLAYDPEILEMFGSLADVVSEDSLDFSKARVTPNRDSQLKDIIGKPAFTDALHVDHLKVMEEYWALFPKGNVKQEG